MKRVLVFIWVVGAIAGATLQYLADSTVMRGVGPSDLQSFVIFWPILTFESLGESACVHGCSGSILYGTGTIFSRLLPIPLPNTLTVLIVCVGIARLIARGRRRRQGRLLR